MTELLTTDTDLTTVANAIRERGGTSSALTFPQGFADAIAAIPGGGGVQVKTGKFTVESNVRNVTIAHGLGTVPMFACVFADAPTTLATTPIALANAAAGVFNFDSPNGIQGFGIAQYSTAEVGAYKWGRTTFGGYGVMPITYTGTVDPKYPTIYGANASTFVAGISDFASSGDYRFKPGITYLWLAVG